MQVQIFNSHPVLFYDLILNMEAYRGCTGHTDTHLNSISQSKLIDPFYLLNLFVKHTNTEQI